MAIPSGTFLWYKAVVSAPLFDSAFLAKLEQLQLLARRLFHGQNLAERRSRQTGSSLEFADYRNYTPGDDLRTVDWNVYGRLDRLFVKLFEAERDLPVSFLIDASASMRWQPEGAQAGGKFDHARQVAAALAYIALSSLDRVNLFFFSADLGTDLGFVRGRQQFHAVLEFLRREPEGGRQTTDLSRSFRSFAHRLKRRGLVFVLSDFFDPQAAQALAFLRRQQFEPAALQVLAPWEADPALRGDLRLRDAETGTTLDLTADPGLLRRYREAFARFQAELEATCRQRAIGLVRTTTEIPFEDLVLRVLRENRLAR